MRQLSPQCFPGLFSHHSYFFNVIRKPKVPVPLHLFLCFVNLQYVCYDCDLRSQCFPGLPNLGTLVAENAGRRLAEMALECLGANWRQARIVVLAGTMTLALPKTGLARGQVGQLVLADIGIRTNVYGRLGLTHVPPFGDRFRVPLSIRGAWDVRP